MSSQPTNKKPESGPIYSVMRAKNARDERGPVYGVKLTDSLPIGTSAMRQACPSRAELEAVREVSERTVAAYEVLLQSYRDLLNDMAALLEKHQI